MTFIHFPSILCTSTYLNINLTELSRFAASRGYRAQKQKRTRVLGIRPVDRSTGSQSILVIDDDLPTSRMHRMEDAHAGKLEKCCRPRTMPPSSPLACR